MMASPIVRWPALVRALSCASLITACLGGCLSPKPVDPGQSLRVGGPCRYDAAVGTARILEVFPGSSSVELVVALQLPAAFKPAAWWHDRTARVVISGPSGRPDGRWLIANGIVAGASYPVEVSVIRSGTCTPVLLRFPGRGWIVQ